MSSARSTADGMVRQAPGAPLPPIRAARPVGSRQGVFSRRSPRSSARGLADRRSELFSRPAALQPLRPKTGCGRAALEDACSNAIGRAAARSIAQMNGRAGLVFGQPFRAATRISGKNSDGFLNTCLDEAVVKFFREKDCTQLERLPRTTRPAHLGYNLSRRSRASGSNSREPRVQPSSSTAATCLWR